MRTYARANQIPVAMRTMANQHQSVTVVSGLALGPDQGTQDTSSYCLLQSKLKSHCSGTHSTTTAATDIYERESFLAGRTVLDHGSHSSCSNPTILLAGIPVRVLWPVALCHLFGSVEPFQSSVASLEFARCRVACFQRRYGQLLGICSPRYVW
jgi:hypothetical protein